MLDFAQLSPGMLIHLKPVELFEAGANVTAAPSVTPSIYIASQAATYTCTILTSNCITTCTVIAYTYITTITNLISL